MKYSLWQVLLKLRAWISYVTSDTRQWGGVYKTYISKMMGSYCTVCKYCWYCAGIFKQNMGTRNRVGIGLSNRPAARLHRLAELIPGFHKRLKIRAQAT